jgi:uncharacterized membrane protein YdjX (TVP38/TMEM64 family)
MNQPKKDKGVWIQIALLAALIVVVSAALWYWHEPLWELFDNQERLKEWVESFGPVWGPLVSMALNAAQVLAAPIPGQTIGIANGLLYGLWRGTLYSMVGLIVGRTLAMLLGRWFGRRLVERLVDPQHLARWDEIIRHRGPFFLFLIFLVPFLPDDLVCFLIGLSSLSIPHMVILSALGGLPGVFVSCWLGANMAKWTELPVWMWVVLITGAIVLAWGLWRYGTQVETAMVSLIERLTPRRTKQPEEQMTKYEK